MITIQEVTLGDRCFIPNLRGSDPYEVCTVLYAPPTVFFTPMDPNCTKGVIVLDLPLVDKEVKWTYQYQKTQLTPITYGIPIRTISRKELEVLYPNKTGCPACGGETELKTFSSFSYTYCPICKEDVSVLAQKTSIAQLLLTALQEVQKPGTCTVCGSPQGQCCKPFTDNIPF